MYWGSVRFYKHCILLTVLLMIIIPTVGCVYLGFKCFDDKSKIDSYKQIIYSQQFVREYENWNRNPEVQNLQKTASFDYQEKYEDMYAPQTEFKETESEKPVIYLTFDDGPSENTEKLLDILKENDIMATFFVVYRQGDYAKKIYKRIVDEGHTIGVHSYSHKYSEIYASVDAYMDDFYKMYSYIYEVTGTAPTVFRFPGGSINNYNRMTYVQIIAEMTRRGFVYYDWNVASGDAASYTLSSAQIESNITNGIKDKREANIVLMHDSTYKLTTIEAMRVMIPKLKEKYELRALDPSVHPVTFTYMS